MSHALTLTPLLLFCAVGVVMVGVADAHIVNEMAPIPVSDGRLAWYQDNIPEAYERMLENGQMIDDEVRVMTVSFMTDPSSICVERVTHQSGAIVKFAEPCQRTNPDADQTGWYWAMNDTRFDSIFEYQVAQAMFQGNVDDGSYTPQEIMRAFSDDPQVEPLSEEYVSERSKHQPIEEAIEDYIIGMKWTGFFNKPDDITGQSDNKTEGITVYGGLRYTPVTGYGVTIDGGVSNAKVCLLDQRTNATGHLVYDPIIKLNNTNESAFRK